MNERIIKLKNVEGALNVALKCYVVTLAVALVIFGELSNFTQLNSDSWTLILLANTIGNDFYVVPTIRSFMYDVQAASFPPLFPTLYFFINKILNIGWSASYLINGLSVLIFFVATEKISSILNWGVVERYIIVGTSIGFYPIIDDLFSGNSYLLAVSILAWGLYFLIRQNLALAGLLFGVSVLARFDFLYITILIAGFFIFNGIKQGKYNFKNIKLFSLFYIIALSPWIIYSYKNFGILFVSDNSWVALAVDKKHVLNFDYSTTKIFNDPMRWAIKVIENFLDIVNTIYLSKFYIFYGAIFILISRCFLKEMPFGKFSLACLLLFPSVITGYFGLRYFYPFFTAISLIALQPFNTGGVKFKKFSAILLVLCALGTFVQGSKMLISRLTNNSQAKYQAMAIKRESMVNFLTDCQSKNIDTRYFFLDRHPVNPSFYGLVSGFPSGFAPSDFGGWDITLKTKFNEKYSPYALVSQKEILSENFSNCPLESFSFN